MGQICSFQVLFSAVPPTLSHSHGNRMSTDFNENTVKNGVFMKMASGQNEDAGSSSSAPVNADYDLSTPIDPNGVGLRQKLTSYGDAHFSLFMRKLFIKAMGYSEDALSRPIVGIVNTYSSFNPCHANIPQLIDAAKRGVQLSGGLAIDFPTISLHESFSAPTSMFLRNLMSMDTEEMIRAQPVDSVVLIGGSLPVLLLEVPSQMLTVVL